MSYSGPDVDAALVQFAAKIRSEWPGVTCNGWNINTHIDVDQIRKLMKPPLGTESDDEHLARLQ
jgi:hypothetical protein